MQRTNFDRVDTGRSMQDDDYKNWAEGKCLSNNIYYLLNRCDNILIYQRLLILIQKCSGEPQGNGACVWMFMKDNGKHEWYDGQCDSDGLRGGYACKAPKGIYVC